MTLSRSAWAGMSKQHAALWNGDTQSTFAGLAISITAAQSIQISGIAWWTTDIGGYQGGNVSDPGFRELIVRWFQFGFTCPIFRQHSARNTEPWLLGDAAFGRVRSLMALREKFRPYVVAQLADSAKSGIPFNCPLWFDSPGDAEAWVVDDKYFMGSDYMVAPIYVANATSRSVHFPDDGASGWRHYFSGEVYRGGTQATVPAPIDTFPLVQRVPAV